MKQYTHIQMIRDTNMESFTGELIRKSEELQQRGLILEYEYHPVLYKWIFKKKMIYTCMIKGYLTQ